MCVESLDPETQSHPETNLGSAPNPIPNQTLDPMGSLGQSSKIGDAIELINYLFLGGPAPTAPGLPLPPDFGGSCSPDPDVKGSAADLGCTVYECCGR